MAEVIQASSQLNPERGKIFSFPGQQPENLNFGQRNFALQFSFGEETDFTLDLNSSQGYFPGNPPISHPPVFNPLDFRFGGSTQPGNSFSGRNFGVMATSPFYEDSSEISNESEFSVKDDIYEERSDSDFAERPGSSWTA